MPFVISEYCTIEYAIWYNPDEDVEAVKEEIETYVGHAAAQDEWLRDHPTEVEWKLHWPPLNIPKDHPICRTVSTAHERAARGTRFGGPATLRGLHGVDDATFLGANGIPAMTYGPGHIHQVHMVDEFVNVDELLTSTWWPTLSLTAA